MAAWRSTLLKPTAIDEAAITAGPVKNLTAIANVAKDAPQAMSRGCRAMNKPEIYINNNCFMLAIRLSFTAHTNTSHLVSLETTYISHPQEPSHTNTQPC